MTKRQTFGTAAAVLITWGAFGMDPVALGVGVVLALIALFDRGP